MPGKQANKKYSRGRGRGKGTTSISQSLRAGITFPVGRVGRLLRKDKNIRVALDAPVCLAAVLEYLTAEILELAGNICLSKKKKLITPRHIVLALQDDDELRRLFKNSQIGGGGMIPCGIHPALVKRKADYKKGTQFTQLKQE